jgi:SAM-dependent methyltransferase
MDETTKSKMYWGEHERRATQGHGIDIGCGPDPVTKDARRFDKEDGDANRISDFVRDQFDFVYSSHCLEHMYDPKATILEWWKLVKQGGFLFVLVPDEDLYEQGVFPSRFNPDHKATFTISKSKSWSPKSINVLELAKSLPNGHLVSLELQDRGYDRSLLRFGGRRRPLWIKGISRVLKGIGLWEKSLVRRLFLPYYAVDQTASNHNAQAQIQLIVQKGA